MKFIKSSLRQTGVIIAIVSFSIVLFFQNCAPIKTDVDEQNAPSPTSAETGTTPQKVIALQTCSKIRYSFKTFTSAFTDESGTYYGGQFYRYSNTTYPWMVDRPYSQYNISNVMTYRLAGYVVESTDCGQTWTRTPEYINPMVLNGGPDSPEFCSPNVQRANGVNHFITNPNTNFFSQGFVSQIRWDAAYLMRSRIYSVFNSGGVWSYSAVATGEPFPAIGNPNWTIADNFYSPSIVEVGDVNKSIQLYFGGWRAKVVNRNGAPLKSCTGPNGVISGTNSPGYIEKDCTCSISQQLGMAVDSCTGDKIFMATNQFSAVAADKNPLRYQVYRPSDGTYSDNSWDSSLFEPVIYSAMINKGCHLSNPTKCPYSLIHTNDPTVIKFAHPSSPTGYRQIMYFTGGAVPPTATAPSPGYTHMAISDDGGKTWSNFAILTKNANLQFPGGLRYNQANGTVRAYYRHDGTRARILLISVPTPDNELFDNSQADANKLFLYEIDPAQPDVVININRLDKDEFGLSQCALNQTCGVATQYVSQIKTPSNTLNCTEGNLTKLDGMLGLPSNGDRRFLCAKGTWYECGWELSNPARLKARDGQMVANYTCNLAAKSWVIQKPMCQNDCNANGNIGKDGKVGLPNGDSRFLCVKGSWYDCGWGMTDLTWETSALHGQVVGNFRCDRINRRWIPQ